MTDTLKAQTIELYSKQLRTPMFNKYLDVIRQLDKNQGYEDFLIALMRVELDSLGRKVHAEERLSLPDFLT